MANVSFEMSNLKEKLSALLIDEPNERVIHQFLKENPLIVRNTFATAWNYAEVFSEVPLGAEFRADFLVLCANSGSWHCHIIELKKPTVALYESNGDESKDLRLVKRQLEQRKAWVNGNQQYFRKTLAKLLARDDPGALCSGADEHVSAVTEIQDSSTSVWDRYHAVIGRSSEMSQKEKNRRREQMQIGGWGSPEILTYDRFLGVARKLDEYE